MVRERDRDLNQIWWDWILIGRPSPLWPRLDQLKFDVQAWDSDDPQVWARRDESVQAQYMRLVTGYRIWYRRARSRIRNWRLKLLEIATKGLPIELLQRIYTMSIS